MSIRFVPIVAIAVLMAGCESESAKLQRLQYDLTFAQVVVSDLDARVARVSGQRSYDSLQALIAEADAGLTRLRGQEYIKAFDASRQQFAEWDKEAHLLFVRTIEPEDSIRHLLDSLRVERKKAEVRRDLAQRALNRFMYP